MGKMLTRQEAWELLTRYTKTPSLQKHALAVEAVMKHFAKLNKDRKSTRLNSSHLKLSRMPSSA